MIFPFYLFVFLKISKCEKLDDLINWNSLIFNPIQIWSSNNYSVEFFYVTKLNIVANSWHCNQHFVLTNFILTLLWKLGKKRPKINSSLNCLQSDISQFCGCVAVSLVHLSYSIMNLVSQSIYKMRSFILIFANSVARPT